MRLFLGDQSVVITKDFFFALRRWTSVFAVFSSSRVNSLFEVRPRRASGLAVCSCGNKRGTRESKELVGVAAPSDPVGSILVEILHSVEGGDVEQVCSNLETNLPYL